MDVCPGLWDKHHPTLVCGGHLVVTVQAPEFQFCPFLKTVWPWASCLTTLSLCGMGVLLPPDLMGLL